MAMLVPREVLSYVEVTAAAGCNFINNGVINIANENDNGDDDSGYTINIDGSGQFVNNGNITINVQGGITIGDSSNFFQCTFGVINFIFSDPAAYYNTPSITFNNADIGAVYMDGMVNVIIPNTTVSNDIENYCVDNSYITLVNFAEEGTAGNQPFYGRAAINVFGGVYYPFTTCFYIGGDSNGECRFYDPTNYNPNTDIGSCITLIRNVTTNVFCDIYAQPPPYVPPPISPVPPSSTPITPQAPIAPVPSGPIAPQAPIAPVPSGPIAPQAPVPTGPVAPHEPIAPVPTGPTVPHPAPAGPTPVSSGALLTGSFVLLLLCFSALFI